MPMDKSLYPPNWTDIATAIKDEADWKCEQCGRPCRKPGQELMEFFSGLGGTRWTEWVPGEDFLLLTEDEDLRSLRASFTLTVAHLNHRPEDCRRENLRALCAPCHLYYDAQAMATKKRLKAERQGQLTLFPQPDLSTTKGGLHHA